MHVEKRKLHKEAKKQPWIFQVKTMYAALSVFYINDCGDWYILRALSCLGCMAQASHLRQLDRHSKFP